MSGNNFLLDTNAIIELLQNENNNIIKIVDEADWIGISIISYLEFCSFPKLTNEDIKLIDKFVLKVEVIDLNSIDDNLISKIIEIRQKYNVKLPDAIISASAITYNSSLITNDKELSKIKELNLISF